MTSMRANETAVRAISAGIISLWLPWAAALTTMALVGAQSPLGAEMTPLRMLLFAPASIIFMVYGLVMVAWGLAYLSIAAGVECLILAAAKARRGEWPSSTLVLAALAALGNLTFLLHVPLAHLGM